MKSKFMKTDLAISFVKVSDDRYELCANHRSSVLCTMTAGDFERMLAYLQQIKEMPVTGRPAVYYFPQQVEIVDYE